jgi:hypothetical protein
MKDQQKVCTRMPSGYCVLMYIAPKIVLARLEVFEDERLPSRIQEPEQTQTNNHNASASSNTRMLGAISTVMVEPPSKESR